MDTATKPKLLLADDSVTIRKVVELTFADEGIEVSTVADADAAMQKFVEIQPAIVLVDVGLRETSGYRICEMIKQDEATRHIPVLLLVGSFEPFDQDEAERVGADGFLTKPFHSIRDLVARVWDLLGRQIPAEAAISETVDIENLYESSFADTMEIEDRDIAADLLGDAGMDDELIEASYATADSGPNGESTLVSQPVEATKEFEWSPGPMVTQTGASAPIPDAINELEIPSAHRPDTKQITAVEDTPPDGSSHKHEEPSPEFIALVAERVVEALSDRVIREIAQNTVPRIAEKLIREALEEDKKQ